MEFIEKVKRLKQGSNDLILGSWINTASPIVAEIMSQSGFDFLCVDAEHSAVDYYTTLQLFQAIKAGNPNCAPLVRMQGNQYADTKRYLDAGAMGVIAPLINTREEAEKLVEAVKYPPKGNRGVGYGRSHEYGFNFNPYMEFALGDNLFTAVQIEHIKGVEQFEDIATVEGIDGVFVGPYDLTASMGITAQFDHPEYQKALRHILEVAERHHLVRGIHVVQPNIEEVYEKQAMGYNLIAYSLDITMIGKQCRDAVQAINQHK